MLDRALFERAICECQLLKINYGHKGGIINAGVIRPLRFNEKGKLIAYSYNSSSERILEMKHITAILPFQAELIDGDKPEKIKDFRWLVGKSVVPLWENGWRINTDEEYLGIYPRSKDDTTETSKGYAEQFAYLQYLKSPRHPFHVWFKEGEYLRFDEFDAALERVLAHTLKHPIDTSWTMA